MIGLALLAAGTAGDTQQLQRQLDFIVSMCRADDVVRFVAHGGNEVAMEMATPGQIPSVSQNAALQCALARVRARPDLHLAAKTGAPKK